LSGGFLEDDVLEIGIGFYAFGDEDYVDYVDGEEDNCWCEGVLLREDEDEEDLDGGAY
jgi:hypothetical protein